MFLKLSAECNIFTIGSTENGQSELIPFATLNNRFPTVILSNYSQVLLYDNLSELTDYEPDFAHVISIRISQTRYLFESIVPTTRKLPDSKFIPQIMRAQKNIDGCLLSNEATYFAFQNLLNKGIFGALDTSKLKEHALFKFYVRIEKIATKEDEMYGTVLMYNLEQWALETIPESKNLLFEYLLALKDSRDKICGEFKQSFLYTKEYIVAPEIKKSIIKDWPKKMVAFYLQNLERSVKGFSKQGLVFLEAEIEEISDELDVS